jgi:hypothetical protein
MCQVIIDECNLFSYHILFSGLYVLQKIMDNFWMGTFYERNLYGLIGVFLGSLMNIGSQIVFYKISNKKK